MRKHLVSLTDRQSTALYELAEQLGISFSELLRRSVDRYIDDEVRVGSVVRFILSDHGNYKLKEIPLKQYEMFRDYVERTSLGSDDKEALDRTQ